MGFLKDLAIAALMVALAFLIALFLPAGKAHGEVVARTPYLLSSVGWLRLHEQEACPTGEWDLVPTLLRDGAWRTGLFHPFAPHHDVPFCWDLGFNEGQLVVMVKFFGEKDVTIFPLVNFEMRSTAPVQGEQRN